MASKVGLVWHQKQTKFVFHDPGHYELWRHCHGNSASRNGSASIASGNDIAQFQTLPPTTIRHCVWLYARFTLSSISFKASTEPDPNKQTRALSGTQVTQQSSRGSGDSRHRNAIYLSRP
jgi:hypothetical protein